MNIVEKAIKNNEIKFLLEGTNVFHARQESGQCIHYH